MSTVPRLGPSVEQLEWRAPNEPITFSGRGSEERGGSTYENGVPMEHGAVQITAELARRLVQTESVAETLAVLRQGVPDVNEATAAALHARFHVADGADELSDEALDAIAGGGVSTLTYVYCTYDSGYNVSFCKEVDSNGTIIRSWTD